MARRADGSLRGTLLIKLFQKFSSVQALLALNSSNNPAIPFKIIRISFTAGLKWFLGT